jgi:hypothetical protein
VIIYYHLQITFDVVTTSALEQCNKIIINKTINETQYGMSTLIIFRRTLIKSLNFHGAQIEIYFVGSEVLIAVAMKGSVFSTLAAQSKSTDVSDQWYSTWGMRTPGGTGRHLRGYVTFHQQVRTTYLIINKIFNHIIFLS